ncbi:MAG: V-type ATP synthase subunit F [Thermodesulfovibrionales bacterium]|nr:V-type ATP synthase subunit F [Thermodesulfovibrionales bacterium]
MKKIVFITLKDAEYGFSLAGVTQYAVAVREAEDTLKKALAEPDAGVIVIDERLIKGISEEKMKNWEEKWYGVFLILPAPEKPVVEIEDYALRLIRRAIGYHVRLKL